MDTGSHPQFYRYYAEQGERASTFQRFRNLNKSIENILNVGGDDRLRVADIGCGPGTSSLVWSSRGHFVAGLDINQPLLDLARSRARERGLNAEFLVGSAHALPWPNDSFDVCLLPELLEHVPRWEPCLDEIQRVLRPGGLLFISTTNTLCPVQREYRLPLFSWYPSPLKRFFARQAAGPRPQLANYATYPAVNWFNFYSLRRALVARGFTAFWDRFDMAAARGVAGRKGAILAVLRGSRLARFVGYVTSPGCQIVAAKAGFAAADSAVRANAEG